MTGQVQFYISGVHAVGGVTTWSFQAASFLASRYPTRIVSINSGVQACENLFPGQVTKVWRNAKDASRARANGDNVPDRPSKSTEPGKPAKKPVKPTKPAKTTKPTKKPIEPPSGIEVDSSTSLLHPSAKRAIEKAKLFIPNYLDFAYQLAARSRLQGIASHCIGICHCDQGNYYRLLTHYAPIIHSFIAVSPRCMDRLIECLPARKDDIHFIPYGVAPPGVSLTRPSNGTIRLLYAGRIARRQKRIFDLVDIVRELDGRGIDYQLDIVGVGPDREPLVAAFAGFPRVRFYPGVPQTEIAGVYQDHDVFLLPSETEGTSIALLESMAHGLVPVATRVSGSEDVIVDGANGFLCDVGDIGCIAKSISALANNDSMRSQLAKKAKETVAQNYQIDAQLKAFERCVQQTLRKPLVTPEAAQSVLRNPV